MNSDAAPKGERTIFMYETDPLEPGGRNLNARLFADLVAKGRRTLAFSRSRLETELLLRETRRLLENESEGAGGMIDSYRGGYTPAERREIEGRLFSGDLVGLATTNALELGIDVGTLDAVLLNGFPGRVSSFWQQVGRVARGGRPGSAVFVAKPDPLEIHLLRHPYLLLDADVEDIHLNPENPQILGPQLLCGAYECPLAPSDLADFGESALALAESLDRRGDLAFVGGRFALCDPSPPALGTSLRSGEGQQIRLVLEGAELGSMERWRGLTSAHEGAVYLHRGESYRVAALDLANSVAHVQATTERVFTQSQVVTEVDLRETWAEEPVGEGALALAPMTVTDSVVGYRTRSLDTFELLGTAPLMLPPNVFATAGLAVEFPLPGPDEDPGAFAAALHGAEHALLALAPIFAGCDPNDLGSAYAPEAPGSGMPTVFVFDRHPGGVGLAQACHARRAEWIAGATALLAECGCDDGCPRCVLSSRCPQANEGLSKAGALALLRTLA